MGRLHSFHKGESKAVGRESEIELEKVKVTFFYRGGSVQNFQSALHNVPVVKKDDPVVKIFHG